MSRFDELAQYLEGNEDALRLVSELEQDWKDEVQGLRDDYKEMERENETLQDRVEELAEEYNEMSDKVETWEMQRELLTALADSKNWTDGRFTPIETKFQLWDVDQLADRALRGVL